MKYVRLKPQRLHCPACNETYDLPQNGTIKVYQVGDAVTSAHSCRSSSALLTISSWFSFHSATVRRQWCVFSFHTLMRQGKSFPLCPYCYNNPPFENMTKMGCDSCLHPTCKHSSIRNAVCPCTSDNQGSEEAGCGGMMVLDTIPRESRVDTESGFYVRTTLHRRTLVLSVSTTGILDIAK